MEIQKTTLKDQAHDYIKNAILSKELKMDRNYSVPELSAMLNISRTPVREAILKLEQEGFVTILANKGMRIKPLDRRTALDIFEHRMAVEGFACYYLASHREDSEAQKVILFLEMISEDHAKSYYSASVPNHEFYNNDFLFHHKIVEYTENKRFIETNSNLSLYISNLMTKMSRWETAIKEHADILDAIKSGDPHAARNASDTHVMNSYRALMAASTFDNEEGGKPAIGL